MKELNLENLTDSKSDLFLQENLLKNRKEAFALQTPNLDEFKNIPEYFRSFYDLNRDHEAFSCRKFSKLIGWPHSYLNDLIAGRKNLTVSRALEFSRFLKLTIPETERLIKMSFQSSESPAAAGYFQQQLSLAHDLDSRHSTESIGAKLATAQIPVIENYLMTPAFYMICALVSWVPKPLAVDEVRKLCKQLPMHLTVEEIDTALSELKGLNLIEIEDANITQFHQAYFVGAAGQLLCSLKVMRGLLEQQNQKQLPVDPSRRLYRNGIVEFPKERIPELTQRMSSLANWIGNISRECLQDPDYQPEQNPLIKYDLFYSELLTELPDQTESVESEFKTSSL